MFVARELSNGVTTLTITKKFFNVIMGKWNVTTSQQMHKKRGQPQL